MSITHVAFTWNKKHNKKNRLASMGLVYIYETYLCAQVLYYMSNIFYSSEAKKLPPETCNNSLNNSTEGF